MCIEVGLGELVDKWVILCIKLNNVKDVNKQINIEKEEKYLRNLIPIELKQDELKDQLLKINQELWDIEEKLREYEKLNLFNDSFIQNARMVYKTNDERSRIKKQINLKYMSVFVEEKSYID